MFRDRLEAGRALAGKLERYRDDPGLVVVALPRGGVPVGYEVAQAFDAPLDVCVVRKLGAPGRPELAVGAIASDGTCVVNERVVRELGLDDEWIERAAAAERGEVARREAAYRRDRAPIGLTDRTAILVDDGLATGATMRVAALALGAREPRRIVVAVPVAAEETCEELRREVGEVVSVLTPHPFVAVGISYRDFAQTTDDEVRELLERARRQEGWSSSPCASA